MTAPDFGDAEVGGDAPPGAGPAAQVLETLASGFEALGLTPYEARVLVALLSLGSANTQQLARVSGVPRTSTYQVLESLGTKGLAQRLPGTVPVEWGSLGRDAVMQRLAAVAEEELRRQLAQAGQLRELMDRALPDAPGAAQNFLRILTAATQLNRTYEDLLVHAEHEVLIFSRPPYGWMPARAAATPMPGRPNPLLLAALERGVTIRTLYQAEQVEEEATDAFCREMAPYHVAGMVPRVVDLLPMKLVVFDRAAALVSLPDPVAPDLSAPTHVVVEHPGFAVAQAAAFERYWDQSRQFPMIACDGGVACGCCPPRQG